MKINRQYVSSCIGWKISSDLTCKQSMEETSKVNYERDAQKNTLRAFFDYTTHSSDID